MREALLDALPDATVFDENGFEIRPVVDWRARNSRDLGLMLLEMWAYVSDVLSFYDERIANESYIARRSGQCLSAVWLSCWGTSQLLALPEV